MRCLKLTLAYEGTAFAGWQVQPGERTAQGVLEEALQQVTGERIRVVASGRTDAGVHALGQVASFRTECPLAPDVILRALNAYLPADMVVCGAAEAAADFHALRDAVRKRYRYLIDDGPVRDVFSRRYAWHVRQQLDVERMHHAAQALRGRHDFASFQASGSRRKSSVRTVTDLYVERLEGPGRHRLAVEVEADGFLYNMVRNIVGVLVEVGRGAQDPSWPAEVLAAKDRSAGAATAPPHGLFLVQVDY